MTKFAKKKIIKSVGTKSHTSKLQKRTNSQASPQRDRGSKQSRVITMLSSADGTTVADIMAETGWQQHSVRGFLAGVVRRKLKLKLSSGKADDGTRVYRVEAASRSQSRARSALSPSA